MNKELKKFAMSKIYFLIAAWIVILGVNTILTAIAFDCGVVNLSYFISHITPFLIILYGILWWTGVNAEFDKIKKLQVKDDSRSSLIIRNWKEN